jgi:hypothetical protein
MQARLRPNKKCGCTLEQAVFLILLWNACVRAAR